MRGQWSSCCLGLGWEWWVGCADGETTGSEVGEGCFAASKRYYPLLSILLPNARKVLRLPHDVPKVQCLLKEVESCGPVLWRRHLFARSHSVRGSSAVDVRETADTENASRHRSLTPSTPMTWDCLCATNGRFGMSTDRINNARRVVPHTRCFDSSVAEERGCY